MKRGGREEGRVDEEINDEVGARQYCCERVNETLVLNFFAKALLRYKESAIDMILLSMYVLDHNARRVGHLKGRVDLCIFLGTFSAFA